MFSLSSSPVCHPYSSWEALLPTIDRLAARVGRRFPAHIAQGLRDEAPSHVVLRLNGYEPTKGQFEPWCSRVVYRLGVDLWRRSRTTRRLTRPTIDLDRLLTSNDRLAIDEEIDRTHRDLHQAQELVARLHWPSLRRGVDYYAVFQLQVRLALASRMAPALERGGPVPPRGLVLVVEDCWAWQEGIIKRRCIPTWPTLGELWPVLGPHFAEPPFRVSGTKLCQLITTAGLDQTAVPSDTWAKWCQRARDLARNQITAVEAMGLFCPWLWTA